VVSRRTDRRIVKRRPLGRRTSIGSHGLTLSSTLVGAKTHTGSFQWGSRKNQSRAVLFGRRGDAAMPSCTSVRWSSQVRYRGRPAPHGVAVTYFSRGKARENVFLEKLEGEAAVNRSEERAGGG